MYALVLDVEKYSKKGGKTPYYQVVFLVTDTEQSG